MRFLFHQLILSRDISLLKTHYRLFCNICKLFMCTNVAFLQYIYLRTMFLFFILLLLSLLLVVVVVSLVRSSVRLASRKRELYFGSSYRKFFAPITVHLTLRALPAPTLSAHIGAPFTAKHGGVINGQAASTSQQISSFLITSTPKRRSFRKFDKRLYARNTTKHLL